MTIGKYKTPLPLRKNQHYYSSPCACVFSCVFLALFGLFAALSFIELFTKQSNWLYQMYTKPISYYENNQTVCESYFGCEEMTVENLLDMIVNRREYYISMNAVLISFSRCQDDSFVQFIVDDKVVDGMKQYGIEIDSFLRYQTTCMFNFSRGHPGMEIIYHNLTLMK